MENCYPSSAEGKCKLQKCEEDFSKPHISKWNLDPEQTLTSGMPKKIQLLALDSFFFLLL